MTIIDQLIKHEGYRAKPYKCTANKTTIGYGRNLEDNGIDPEEALYLLKNDIRRCEFELTVAYGDGYKCLPKKIQEVLINMNFNLGFKGLMKFKKMLKACFKHNWNAMAKEMKDSQWYTQVGQRADDLIKIVLEEK